MSQAETKSTETPQRRWPGIVFSFFTPGAGHLRAGNTRRALILYATFWILGMMWLYLVAASWFPMVLKIAVIILYPLGFIWMLIDSWKPGKMTGKGWAVFVVLLALNTLGPVVYPKLALPYFMPTGSMQPTIMGNRYDVGVDPSRFVLVDPPLEARGDNFLVDRTAYWFSKPKRGDIIEFTTYAMLNRTPVVHHIKRLVGFPGETIEFKDGGIFIDGRKLNQSDGIPPFEYDAPDDSPHTRTPIHLGPYRIPPDVYFVVGDNSKYSEDSRHWGGVPAENILGKATLIYYPLRRFGALK